MPRANTLLRIFLASPGDVAEERKIARSVIEEVNRSIAIPAGYSLQTEGWETDAFPQIGKDGQAVINDQLLRTDPHDLFVGIMWNRFGTPTPRAASGTEEEFALALDSNQKTGHPEVMFYFCNRPAVLDRFDDLDQRRKVIEFKGKVQANGLTSTYTKIEDFERNFRAHLIRWIESKKSRPSPAASSVANPPPTPAPVPRHRTTEPPHQKQWLLLKERFFEFDSLDDDGNGNLTIQLPQPPPEDEAMLRSFQSNDRWNKPTISYAVELDGGDAIVQKAERSHRNGAATWTLNLTVERGRQNGVFEFAVNGLTADQIAEKRARLMLLGEDPGIRDSSIKSMIVGDSSFAKVAGGIFAPMWSQYSKTPGLFSDFARLWAVYHLKKQSLVEHVFELKIVPVRENTIQVTFRGMRKAPYSNEPGAVIQFSGERSFKS